MLSNVERVFSASLDAHVRVCFVICAASLQLQLSTENHCTYLDSLLQLSNLVFVQLTTRMLNVFEVQVK